MNTTVTGQGGKRQFETDSLENDFLSSSEDTAVGLSLMVTSRFVPMDLSYPDDSYPGSDVLYPLLDQPNGRFVPNNFWHIYPTPLRSETGIATNSSSLRKLKRMHRSNYREVQRPLFELWEAFKKEKSLKQLFNDFMIKNCFFCDC